MGGMFSELAEIREQEAPPQPARSVPRAESRSVRPAAGNPHRRRVANVSPTSDATPVSPTEPVVVPPPQPPAAMPPHAAAATPATELAPPDLPAFDLSDPADKTNTYSFTKDELWAINDLVRELDRAYDIQVTRYNLVRLAVHQLIEDFRRTKEQSFAYQRLRHPKK